MSTYISGANLIHQSTGWSRTSASDYYAISHVYTPKHQEGGMLKCSQGFDLSLKGHSESKLETIKNLSLRFGPMWYDPVYFFGLDEQEAKSAREDMFNIYSDAKEVIVILSDEDTASLLTAAISYANSPTDKSYTERKVTVEQAIYKLKHWSRLWTLQEILCAKRVRIYSDNGQDLSQELLSISANAGHISGQTLIDALDDLLHIKEQNHDPWNPEVDRNKLRNLLSQHTRHCSSGTDLVYALWPLFGVEVNELPIPRDSSTTTEFWLKSWVRLIEHGLVPIGQSKRGVTTNTNYPLWALVMPFEYVSNKVTPASTGSIATIMSVTPSKVVQSIILSANEISFSAPYVEVIDLNTTHGRIIIQRGNNCKELRYENGTCRPESRDKLVMTTSSCQDLLVIRGTRIMGSVFVTDMLDGDLKLGNLHIKN